VTKRTDSIAYCGLYCGTCPAFTGSMARPGRELRGELRRNKCDQTAACLAKIPGLEAFAHYEPFDALLATLARMRCRNSCRTGGGAPECRIRKCAQGKGLSGCRECEGFAACATLRTLEEFGDIDRTYLKNLRRIRKYGPAGFAKMQEARNGPRG
jgi:hypothetical protein